MTSPLFALSIHKFVSSVGDYIGFAALLAVALLVILYFAHARETATLRERLEDANDRISRLETRVGQLLQVQSLRAQQGAPQQPSVVGPPRVLRNGATAVGPRGSAVGTAALGQLVGGAAGNSGIDGGGALAPSAPAGVGAPALASATKMVGTPAEPSVLTASKADAMAAETSAPTAATTTIPTATTAAGEVAAGGGGSFDDDDYELGDTNVELPAVEDEGGRPVAPAIVANPFGRGSGGSTGLPRVQLRSQDDGDGERPLPRRAIPLPEATGRARPRRGLRAVAGVLAAIVIIGVVVFALVKLTSSGSSPKSQKQVAVKTTTTTATTFNPAKVKVAVLNGTAMAGLAKDVSNFLAKKGYVRANVTNGPNQTQVTSVVSYVPGEIVAAQHVATALGLASSAVTPATSAVIQACATSPSSTAGTCRGDVIVTVGSDQEKLASSGTNSGG